MRITEIASRRPLSVSSRCRSPATRSRPSRSIRETVWLTVRDHNPDPQFNGLNWQAIHDAFKPRIQSAKSIAEVRDILRDMMDRQSAGDPKADCIATLSYVFDHATRDLASRLTHAHHEHHDLSVASMHVHLDHESCLEVSVLRGATGSVTADLTAFKMSM